MDDQLNHIGEHVFAGIASGTNKCLRCGCWADEAMDVDCNLKSCENARNRLTQWLWDNVTFVNLTPHTINLPDKVFPTSGKVARCSEMSEPAYTFAGIEFIHRTYGEVVDLPEPQTGTIYIVSALVRMQKPDRTDLASPGDIIRDDRGTIIGAKNLIANF